MWHCPECGNELIWQSDWDDDFAEDGNYFYTLWSCTPCDIDVTKRVYCGPTEEDE